MKLLKHLATFGGIYAISGIVYWLLAIKTFPLVAMHEFGIPYWNAVAIVHAGLALWVWFFYGAIKS